MKTRLNLRLCPLNAALVLAGMFAMPGSGIALSTDAVGGSTDWNIPATWTSGVPDSTTDARVPNAAGPVTLNGAGAASTLEMQGSGEVIVTTTNGALMVGGIIKVGTTAGGPAQLTIQQGGTASARNLFAGDAPQQGIVTVTGAGSTLTLAPIGVGQPDRFEIGGMGAGELHIDAGANVTVNGTRTLHVGDTANGTLFIGSGLTAGTLTADSVILGTAGSSVQFNHAGTTTFSAAVSGNGSLTKSGGGGTTILTGANTYTGGTTVGAGLLQGNTTSLQGNITNNAAVSFNQVTNGTYAGTMSGTGILAKIGAGTLVLTGPNNYSGGTTVTNGTLQGDTTSLQGNITNNGTVNFDQAANGSYTGAMSGAGALTKTGAGTLVLTGANNYTGGTTVTAGTLQGDTTSLQGAITNNAVVNFDQTVNGGYAGAMGGAGTLTKTGAGTLVLTGANNYAGGTTVTTGTLQGDTTSLQGNITNNAAVNFDQAANGTYAGAMSGGGSLTKTGAGNLVLTGVSNYNGATAVNGGTLSVNGTIANSAVTVNNGGTLGGSGTVGSTTIATGGVLAPGNSIGTLTVNGNVTFAAGSTYRVEVDPAGNSDRINATGTATINGGTVDVQAGAGTYAASTQYTLLNAAGGRTGNFAGVTSNLAFLTPTLGYDANNVFLTLARNGNTFASVAITPNQIAASTALQNAGNAGDMGTVQTALTGLSAVQARAAYDASSGAGIVELRRASAGFAANFGNQLQARLGAVQNRRTGTLASSFGDRSLLLAANNTLSDLMAPVSDAPEQKFSLAGNAPALPATSDSGRGLWARGYGSYGNTDGDGNAAASRLRSAGLSIGFDAELQEGLHAGAAVTSGTSRLSTDNNETGKTRGTAVAVYGGYVTGAWNFSGSAGMSWGKSHMDRAITFGTLNRIASGDFDSNTLSAYGEATYTMAMDGWTLRPLAGLSFSSNKSDGFTETGAGALNLQVAGQTVNSSKSLLGATASFDAGRIRFEPRVIWAHEFGDLNKTMTAQLQGAAASFPFEISGTALKRDTLILGMSATGSIGKGVDLFADVQAEHNANQRNLAVLVGLRSRW